ncbi:MAG: TIGR04219 family outer membrane beta-barrel protein [Persephonella sp.]|nr:TIGR04219 family outer membrane beta-barrel protein [Persephonella sp.]
MKKAVGLLFLSSAIFCSSFAVPGIDGEISAGYMKQKISGWVQYKGDRADIKDDLNIGDKNSYFIRVKLEHPVPLLPNIKLQYTKMRFTGDGTVTKSYTFGNITVNVNDRVQTKLDLDHYDAVLFYNLPFINIFQIIDAEIGLNIRVVDFYAKVRDVTGNIEDSTSFLAPIPMLYGSLEIKPAGFLSLLVEANGIAYQGSHYYDITGEVRIKPIRNILADFYIGGGYRYEKLKIDDVDNTSADVKIKQPYISAGILF